MENGVKNAGFGGSVGTLQNGGITIPWRGTERAHRPAGRDGKGTGEPDIICFSTLRWDFVYQRPHHLLSRCAADHRVFFVEEAVMDADDYGRLEIDRREHGVWVVVPHLPADISAYESNAHLSDLLSDLIREREISEYILWYCSAQALPFTRHLDPISIIYDCGGMESVNPMHEDEAELSFRADLIFTGDHATYERKRTERANVFAFPNGVDRMHFATGRSHQDDPLDQAAIARPRLGFFGVIDNRIDFALIDQVAEARPDWQVVLVGPIGDLDAAALPCRPNIHYLGTKPYRDIPAYLSGWDVAMLPMKQGEACHVSPTKIPECLAAGIPVVSTSIRDAVIPYGETGLISIADTLSEFIIAAAETGMDEAIDSDPWFEKVDRYLADTSWENTWTRMKMLIDSTTETRRSAVILAAAGR